jgi:hypothetical protein
MTVLFLTQSELTSLIVFIAGALISLATSYLPWFNTWYAGLESKYKPLLQLGFNIVGALIIFAVSCAQITTWLSCDATGVVFLLKTFVLMLLGNQTAFLLSTQTKSVKEVKEDRRTTNLL